MKKVFLSIYLLVLLLVSFSISPAINLQRVSAAGIELNQKDIIEQVDKKEYCSATLDDNYAGDSVIVVMDKKVGGINKKHNSNFFGSFQKQEITDLTILNEDAKRKVNNDSFRQILQIKLPTNDKDNVLKVIEILKKRVDVYSASPNYIEHLA